MDLFFHHVWWSYDAAEAVPADAVYHCFNLFEAAAWFAFAGLVLFRYAKHRHSLLEPVYALAFLGFALTDVQEAWTLTSWLIWLKGANLAALLGLRFYVIKHFYPGSKLF